MRFTRVYKFSASHRLHAPWLSEDENQSLYGKCNNPYGHGHNYVLHVTVSGPTDPVTGRVVNPMTLDRHVKERVLSVYDHSDINSDVPNFEGVPTTENLARDIARRLCNGWSQTVPVARLERVLIQETGRNKFELRINANK